jgi:hypothetical protein
MGGLFGGGKTKMQYPKKKDVLDLRYPEAIDLENQMRDYFQEVLQSPNMGYTPRQTYSPMDMYAASIEDRPRLMAGVTGKPWGGAGGMTPPPSPGGGIGPTQPRLQGSDMKPTSFWEGSAFARLKPQTPNMAPDWSIRKGPVAPVGGGGGAGGGGTPPGPVDPMDRFQMALDNMGAYLTNQGNGGSKKQRRAMKRLRKLDTEPYRAIPSSLDDSLQGVTGSINDIGGFLSQMEGGASKKQQGAFERLRSLVTV